MNRKQIEVFILGGQRIDQRDGGEGEERGFTHLLSLSNDLELEYQWLAGI